MTVSEYAPSNRENIGLFLNCSECYPNTGNVFNYQWCKHIAAAIADNLDHLHVEPDTRYAIFVPLGGNPDPRVPHAGWCEVRTERAIMGKYIPVTVVKGAGLSPTKWDEELGVIEAGEGRVTIHRMLADFVMSKAHMNERYTGALETRCTSSVHSYHQERDLKSMAFTNGSVKLLHVASIILDGMCIPCQVDTFVDDNYGLDDLGESNSYSGRFGNNTNRTRQRGSWYPDEDVF